jgi:metallo-beta-lactamase family protein
MKISSHGAAQEVTGSCHLLEVGNDASLIDCGMFQGGSRLEARNHDPFPFDPKMLDRVFLTHAHLDHCGRLPLLVKKGFRGPIFATPPTCDIIRYILLDAAHLMHEDYLHQSRRDRRRGRTTPLPLYDDQDVMETLEKLQPVPNDEEKHPYGKHIHVAFHRAGHILGSSFLEMDIKYEANSTRVIFGGDLGNTGRDVMPDFEMPPSCDVVYCESTYGDRNKHRSMKESEKELGEAITESLKRGGNVIIPSFALERSQDVLYELKELYQQRVLPKDVRVYLNSPLAINITRIYQKYPEGLGPQVKALLESGDDPFCFPGVEYTKTEQESRGLNNVKGGSVFIAGSGMCNGGRVIHHLKHNLWREESSVVLVGYQAKDSLGRLLVEGRESVRIYGEEIQVKAKIHTINGFSAHADQAALLHWLEGTGSAEVRLVHGESRGLNGLKQALQSKGRTAVIVEDGVEYPLN